MLPTLALEMKTSQRTDADAPKPVRSQSELAGSRAPVSVTFHLARRFMAQACFGSSHPSNDPVLLAAVWYMHRRSIIHYAAPVALERAVGEPGEETPKQQWLTAKRNPMSKSKSESSRCR